VLAEYATQSVDFDLMAAKLRAGFSGSGQLLVRRRQELIDSRGWYNSSFVNDTRRRWGVDHCLYSLQHLGTSILGMGINRSFGSRPFSSRDQALIEIFHLAIAHVARFATTSTKASQNEARRNALSPRTRDTLDCLLRGASTKHIADELQLSPHTVHHYCKDIFRTFGVKSRSELVANWFTGHR
jgi:DNA-binding CsgD family transcriptional regulator